MLDFTGNGCIITSNKHLVLLFRVLLRIVLKIMCTSLDDKTSSHLCHRKGLPFKVLFYSKHRRQF